MAKLLFALEGIIDSNEELDFDSTYINDNIADSYLDMNEDVLAIESMSEGIDLAIVATERLEEVQGLSAIATVYDGGISPLTSSILNVAIEAICSDIGVSPKQVGLSQVYAAENYNSESSRVQHSAIAVEGLGDFIKNLWEKIKNAFKSLWKKITDFWDKHISTLGRVKKSLASMKEAINNNKHEMGGDGRIEKVPSSLLSTFAGLSNNLTEKDITSYIQIHHNASNDFVKVLNDLSKGQGVMVDLLKKKLAEQTKASDEEKKKKEEESKDTKTNPTEKPKEESTSTESLLDFYYAEENILTDTLKKIGGKAKNKLKGIKDKFTKKKESPADEKEDSTQTSDVKETEDTKSEEKPKEESTSKPETTSEAPSNVEEGKSNFDGNSASFGSEKEPLAGGVYFKYTFDREDDGTITTNVEKETIDASDSDVAILVPSKKELSSVINGTISLIDKTIKSKESLGTYNKGFERTMTEISSLINKTSQKDEDKEDGEAMRAVLKSLQGTSKGILTFSTTLAGLDVQLAKGVLYFTGLCLKQYKK